MYGCTGTAYPRWHRSAQSSPTSRPNLSIPAVGHYQTSSCVLRCLYDVPLYAEGDEAVTYAEAAHLAANLIDESVAKLDSVRLRPMIEAIKNAGEKERSDVGGPYEVREPRVAYIN